MLGHGLVFAIEILTASLYSGGLAFTDDKLVGTIATELGLLTQLGK